MRSNNFAFDLAFQRDSRPTEVADRGGQRLCLTFEDGDFELESKGIPGRRLRHLAEDCGLEIEGLEEASLLLLRFECAIRSLPFAVLLDRQELSTCLLAVALWDVLPHSELRRELRHWGLANGGAQKTGQTTQLVDALWTSLAEARRVPVRRFAPHVGLALVGKAVRLEASCSQLVEGEYRRTMRRLGLPADAPPQSHIQCIMLALVLEEASMMQLKEECRFLKLEATNRPALQQHLFVETLCRQRWEDEGLSVSRLGYEEGAEPDILFISFPESCLDPQQLQQYLQQLLPRYSVKSHSAVVEAGKMVNKVKGLLEDLAAKHSGDMQTHLAFHRSRFQEDSDGSFGLLTDLTLAGVRVPNPKKSFLGRSLCAPGGLRFCLVGAHFPISQLAAILDAEESAQKGGCSTLEAAKRVWAGLLRSVLRSAAKQLRVDRETLLFLQGDLNSRTLLEGRGKDLLSEVLKDFPLQRAIQRGLDLPSGRWYEAAFPDAERGALQLPVTYKFKTNSQTSPLRIGDVMEEAGKARLFPNSVGSETHSPRKYREMLVDAQDACGRWGLAFRKSSFRPFRFPACADRMIFWAPDVLAARLSWETDGGYKVNYEQQGSDHKPVWMDLLLRVAPPTETSASEEVDEDDLAVSVEEAASPATRSAWWARRARAQPHNWNWTPDKDAVDCEICDVPFSLFRRRHHCRYCGRCICDTCSPVACWRILPELDASRASRVCIECSSQSVAEEPE